MTYTIENSRQLRDAYKMLRALKNSRAADDIKRAAREYTAREQENKTIYTCQDRSYIQLVSLPDHLQTAVDADTYFCRHSYMEKPICQHGEYTAWYRIIRRGGRYMAYQLLCTV